MIGTLYIIRNTQNAKVYIGKTFRPLAQRWNDHLNEYKRERSQDRDLYKAMSALGPEMFSIEELGRYEEGLLEEKEIETIKKYNSYIDGYNMTLGGDGKTYFPYSDKEVISKYKELGVVKKVAEYFKCDEKTIQIRLKNNNIRIKTPKEHTQKFIYIPELKRCFGNIKDTSDAIFCLSNASLVSNVYSKLTQVICGARNRKSYLGLTFIEL